MSPVLLKARPVVRARQAVSPGPEAAPRRSAGRSAAQRIGILGGTFDPPHIGHLWLAVLAADQLSLDRVLFMPASQPPHKRNRRTSSITDRLLMTRLAIAGNPALELSTIEVNRPGPSFTIDSIEELLTAYRGARLFLLMAGDSLAKIDAWREPDRLLSLVEWAVAPRPGSVAPDATALGQRFGPAARRIHLLDGPALDVSATDIRHRVAAGRTIRYLVPQAVEEMILDRGLYRRTRPR